MLTSPGHAYCYQQDNCIHGCGVVVLGSNVSVKPGQDKRGQHTDFGNGKGPRLDCVPTFEPKVQ